jgi:hypothetical protein
MNKQYCKESPKATLNKARSSSGETIDGSQQGRENPAGKTDPEVRSAVSTVGQFVTRLVEKESEPAVHQLGSHCRNARRHYGG